MAAFPEGTPCWVDAALPDPEAGKRFYGALFGWSFQPRAAAPGGLPQEDATVDGLLVAALGPKRDGRMPTVWSVYFAADDLARLTGRIETAGGRVITTPQPVGPLGTVAVAADPAGAVFGLWQAGRRPGFEMRGEAGSFCWTEVYTWDKSAADPFYESVFGFTATDLPGGPSGSGSDGGSGSSSGSGSGSADDSMDIRLWSPPGAEPGEQSAVAGRCVLTDAFPPELPGHFLVYFCVKDCDASAAEAVRLGGRVQAPPFDIPFGRIAVLVDNQGAMFAVLAERQAS